MTLHAPGRPLALVTGASSGLGQAFAKRLAGDGYDLILVARRRERLERTAAELKALHKVSVEAVGVDLTDRSGVRRLEDRIADEWRLGLLVNNAGFGQMAPFVEADADRMEALIALQVIAVTRLTRAALPGMIARGIGTIINVSSRLAMSAAIPSPPLPPRAVYAATKAYINALTQLLHAEVEGTGIQVQALCPGLTRTEFFDRMETGPVSFPEAELMAPEDVVTASLKSLDLGEIICVPALDDASRLHVVEQANLKVFQNSNRGAIASRYTS
jgi:short-subunit dehydrogenase